MGTMLQAAGMRGCPEAVAFEHPEVLKKIHRAYQQAGATVHTTNTFGGNLHKLEVYGLQDRLEEINRTAARLCREAVDGLVAGSMGPTGLLMKPYGELSFDVAHEAFRRQAIALAEGGCDLLVVETMSDLLEAKAALIAGLTTGLPVAVNLTFGPDGRTLSGTPPEVAAAVLTACGAFSVGMNCSVGPRYMLPWVEAMRAAGAKNVWASPNAGMPLFDGEKTFYEETPEDFARALLELAKAGANPVGGCCGTNPDYIKAAHALLKDLQKRPFDPCERTFLSSRSRLLSFDAPRAIGERINPTGKKFFADSLRKEDYSVLRSLAREQAEAGVDLLDVNVGLADFDEKTSMRKAVEALIDAVDLPLVLDSSDPEALEEGLKAYPGKALVNSVSGEEKKLNEVLPLARRYGAAVLGLLLDEHGIPDKAEDRVSIARKIRERAVSIGLNPRDVLFDPLVLTAGADIKNPKISLDTLERISSELGNKTVMGLSNVSYGLPKRKTLNRAFLAAALSRGLSAPILNPSDLDLMEEFFASSLLAGHPEFLLRLSEEKKEKDPPVLSALIGGERDILWALAEKEMKENSLPALQVIEQILLPAMEEIGKRFRAGSIFLPQVLGASEAMQFVLARLLVFLPEAGFKRGKVVLATVMGDVHDIGKNIVASLLRTAGFEVDDLGKDVSPEKIAAAARGAKIIGLSALMTTTAPMIRTTIAFLRDRGIELPVLVGGAVLNGELAGRLGADAFAADAVEAVEVALRLVGG
jgi:5-methyltetrahydrofolate--homocysteine methyltransferase